MFLSFIEGERYPNSVFSYQDPHLHHKTSSNVLDGRKHTAELHDTSYAPSSISDRSISQLQNLTRLKTSEAPRCPRELFGESKSTDHFGYLKSYWNSCESSSIPTRTCDNFLKGVKPLIPGKYQKPVLSFGCSHNSSKSCPDEMSSPTFSPTIFPQTRSIMRKRSYPNLRNHYVAAEAHLQALKSARIYECIHLHRSSTPFETTHVFSYLRESPPVSKEPPVLVPWRELYARPHPLTRKRRVNNLHRQYAGY